jgi:predicted neuraminidase
MSMMDYRRLPAATSTVDRLLRCAAGLAMFAWACGSAGAEPLFESEFVFDPAVESHGHVHASCLIEEPGGALRAVWYENGTPLPPPYFSEQQDKRDDVRIGSARRDRGAKSWDKPFVMADTFGVSDNNPCLAIDRQDRLWLIYPTLLGVPDWTWGSALVRYRVALDYEHPGPPIWDKQDILVPHGLGLKQLMTELIAEAGVSRALTNSQAAERLSRWESQLKSNPLMERLGWMPRAHPLVRSDGALVLPLSNENFGLAAMAITKDGGETWAFSKPIPERGLTQPTLAELSDGTVLAFFRNAGPERRIRRSESKDGGLTWGTVTLTDRPHPGAGIEILLLRDHYLALIYNDTEQERERLAVSISTDNGVTWRWTRHLENTPKGRFDYPSIIQARDGSLHATYSYNLKTIKHAHFNEEWIEAGDGK